VYDVFILVLMIAGIASLVVFSYKVFHSRVYPVGMVRKIPSSQAYIDEAGLPDFKTESQSELMSLLNKGLTNREIARYLAVSEQDVKDRLQRMTWKVYAKRRLRSPQSEKHHVHFYLGKTAVLEPLEDSALEEEVVEHGEALKLHSKQFEDFEKRLRRLEIESVQKRQEATEEKPQPPQMVH